MKEIEFTWPKGFYADGLHSGLRKKKLDLGWLYSQVPASAAGVYTTNQFCAAPMALAKYGLLKGHDYTMFPGMHQEHGDAEGRFHEDMVVVDEAARLVTSRGPATAMPYSFKLAEVLGVDTSKLREAMLYNFLLDQK